MRLRTLPVSVSGVLAAIGFNLAGGSFRILPALLCLVFAILCQIASNFANEYFDFRAGRDRAGREGPRRGVTEGDISPEAMKTAVFITLAIAAATGLFLTIWGGLWLIAAGVLIAIGALAYSTGPYPLSTHCLGEVAVVLFFGIIPVNLTYYVQALDWSLPVFLASLAVGLMGANVLIVNNVRDIDADKAVAKHTLATRFGIYPNSALYVLNSLISVACTAGVWFAMPVFWIAVPAAYVTCSIVIVFRLARGRGRALNPLLGMTAVLMMLYSALMCLALAC